MSAELGAIIGTVFAIFVAIVLVWALYPVLAGLSAYAGLFFLVAAGIVIMGAIAAAIKGS